MNWIKKIWNFLKDPKNRRLIIFIVIALFILLFLKQCNTIKKFKIELENQKTENQRLQNNIDASLDTIKTYRMKNGSLRSEISGYVLTIEELKGKYAKLFKDYEYEKNKPPKVIIEYVTIFKEVIKEVPIYVSVDSLGNGFITFKDSVEFNKGNSRILSGNIPYHTNYWTKKDTTLLNLDSLNLFSTIQPKFGTFELKQRITLMTGISTDNKTKKPIIWVQTKYPGITFSDIIGAEILQDEQSKKAVRKLRKEFGIGINIGYGVVLQNNQYHTGPVISVGLSYTPKFLQFGK